MMDGRRLQGRQDQSFQSHRKPQDPGGAVMGAILEYGPRGKDRSNDKKGGAGQPATPVARAAGTIGKRPAGGRIARFCKPGWASKTVEQQVARAAG